MGIEEYLQERKGIVDSALGRYLAEEVAYSAPLHKAMRYSLFAGGKRIRPILCIAAFEAAGGKGAGILPFACALEFIHTYSLIHDDLPAMDDDDFRRGKPTCHKVFGEAVAILAGDALLTESFRLLTDRSAWGQDSVDASVVLDIVSTVARASGASGLVAGQVVDVECEGKPVDVPTLQYIHNHKTGALILASVQIGAILAGARREKLSPFSRYGESVGLAFQIADDILNVEGEAGLLGKKTGSDGSRGKATYPSLFGLEESKRKANELVRSAVQALDTLGSEADPLRQIAEFIVRRDY